MTLKDIDQVYDMTRVDEHVVSHPLDGGDSDTHGWVKGTIVDLELDDENDDLDVIIELPWSEEHIYGYDKNQLYGERFEDLCNSYGYDISEFERLQGEDIWMKLRYVEIDDDGDIKTGTRFKYKKVKTGPNHWKIVTKKAILPILIGAIILFMLVGM